MSKSKAAERIGKSRAAIADHVMDWMAENCRAWSIDRLLTHPYLAIDMALYVCKRMKRTPTHDEIHVVLQTAINARKAGDLRPDLR